MKGFVNKCDWSSHRSNTDPMTLPGTLLACCSSISICLPLPEFTATFWKMLHIHLSFPAGSWVIFHPSLFLNDTLNISCQFEAVIYATSKLLLFAILFPKHTLAAVEMYCDSMRQKASHGFCTESLKCFAQTSVYFV